MALTPRLNPFERLIYRFYEALYLLCLLENVRGPHVATVFDPSSLVAIRRRFLKNLAFLCDNLKGGDSTASIAVQDLPHCNVFWISYNQGPSDEALGFLSSVLEDVKSFKFRRDDRAKAEDDLIRKTHNAIHGGDISTALSRVRHIIGRLAAYIRSVKQLLDDGPRLDGLLDVYEVSAVPVPPSVPLLQADAHTNLRGVLTRIFRLGNKDARFTSSLSYLSHMSQQTKLEDKLLKFHSPDRKAPSVHAEIQMLHHFYDNKLVFVGRDRYIATSKPACMCCKLYFRHHPAACVEPDSHERVWPNWGVVLQPLGQAAPGWAEQRDVLISVNHDIGREVVLVIDQQQAIGFAHPDSLTGITQSVDDGAFDSEDDQRDEENEDLESEYDYDGGVQI
ncbi:hypothetical protein J7T55_007471 [Diaporthe amygdali]|uniref:uncharacterized protein n=1 Tax=Phomopsis amygdali TaxID=1214568 RepID=UPI0022FE46AA|nr:uncharacterized protein J7T55_007471 [Diaporthe amygdali]KAJ0116491.1 hypothetical protein J7T55_007471 [Diaporthe amygdali]